MYDMAKRSLAFTVATGGLLLTGTGYAPADAAVGFGTFPGPAQAQGSTAASQAFPTSVSTPISVRAAEVPGPPAAAVAPQPVHVLTPPQPRAGGSGAAAAASSTVNNSGGILTGNTVEIPIYLGLNLCSNQADGVAGSNTVAGSTCGGSGAAGGANSGASATSTTNHSRGILSGNTIQAPINIPINACGNQVIAGGVRNKVGGGTCGTGGGSGSGGSGGASATAVTDHSGGILSGNIIQAPVNLPINACGNQADAVGARNTVTGTDCSTTSGSGTGGANATAVTNHSGGIGSGMAIQAPINVPVNACGNQVTAVGVRNTVGGTTCTNSGGGSSALAATMNSGGIVSGNSGQLPINVPVEACGNQVGAVSANNTTGTATCSGPTSPNANETSVVTNSGGLLSGNQPSVPINVPVNVCGDQAAVGVGNTAGSQVCGTPNHECPSCGPSPSPSPSMSTSMSASPSSSPSSSTSSSASPSTSPSVSPSTSPSVSASPSSSVTGSPSPSSSGSQSPCPACSTATPTTPATASVPPSSPASPPAGSGHAPGSLAHTGGEEGIALAIGAGALLAGVGARVASRRRSRR